MHFLVTGGAGFIGSHLVEHLVAAEHRVTVLDNFLTGRRENLAPFSGSITLVEGSITDPEACRRAMRGVEFVLHQAALPSVPRSVRDPLATHEANATGTLNLLIAAQAAGVKRVVYAASSSAYGNTVELPKRESMPSRPLSPYAASKLAGEVYASVFHATYGLESIALRYFNVFGPRQNPASQYAAAVPRFIVAALANDSPVIYGDGEQTRDFTYVANVVRANMLACEAPPAACGRVFNVGCGQRITVNEIWNRIRELTGSTAEARYEPGRAGDVRDSLASLDEIRKYLGYEPEVGLADGLRRTVESFAPERVTSEGESVIRVSRSVVSDS